MAIDFPNSPSTNDTYTVGNKTWIYDGTTWNTYNSTTFSAETLPGTTIKSTVTGSSLTSVGTLGSLTVTGDVTVDTNTLKVDSTNNRVGVGTVSPSTALQVVGTVTATAFAGALTGNVIGNVTGNVTGNVSGTAATVTGAAQTNITSVGTLTSLTIDGPSSPSVFFGDWNQDNNWSGIRGTHGYLLTGSNGGLDTGVYLRSESTSHPIRIGSNNTNTLTVTNTSATVAGTMYATTFSGALSGNASTATNLSTNRTNWSTNGTISAVVGQLAWKNYGNSHTIFDASNSTSPNGGAVNNTNPAVAWTATYPTLMGWNGTSTYGVRVDSARTSDTVTGAAQTAITSVGTLTSITFSGNTSLAANNTYQCAALPAFGFNAWAGVSSYNFYNASDIRYKANVEELPLGLNFIKLLNPIEFTYVYPEFGEDSDTPTSITEGARLRAGLSAQNVKQALETLNAGDYNFWALADKENPESFQGLDYTGLVAPIIQALKEIDNRLQALENIIKQGQNNGS